MNEGVFMTEKNTHNYKKDDTIYFWIDNYYVMGHG